MSKIKKGQQGLSLMEALVRVRAVTVIISVGNSVYSRRIVNRSKVIQEYSAISFVIDLTEVDLRRVSRAENTFQPFFGPSRGQSGLLATSGDCSTNTRTERAH
jgi:hypothetical protein